MSVNIFFAGQAGFIIENEMGQTLGIDLYLSDCVERLEGSMGYKRLIPKIIDPDSVELDFLVATHPHLDHFDADAIPAMMNGSRTKLFASYECRTLVEEKKIDKTRVEYVKAGDTKECGGYKLHFVNCDHGNSAPDAVGVIVETSGKRIYETGDTCLRLDRVQEYLQFGHLDVLIAPINGAFGNMNEEECARLSGALNPRLTIPCHYGMFADHGGNPGKFLDIMRNTVPDNEIFLITPGERIEV